MNETTTQQTPPQRMTRLEYARAMEAIHGPQALAAWLTIGDVIALYERIEELQRIPAPMLFQVLAAQ
jgi:hypothetical protein